MLVFRDISEKQRIEEQLQNAARLESLGLLAGGIAHDFNNLLAGIFGHIELARRHVSGDERRRQPPPVGARGDGAGARPDPAAPDLHHGRPAR